MFSFFDILTITTPHNSDLESWIEAIYKMRTNDIMQMTEEGAKLQFLKTAQRLPLYGSHTWPLKQVVQRGDEEYEESVWFAMSTKGVRFLDPYARQVI